MRAIARATGRRLPPTLRPSRGRPGRPSRPRRPRPVTADWPGPGRPLMTADPQLDRWVLVWAAGALYLVLRHWRDGAGVGLLLTYLVSFGVLQCFPAALHLLP